LSMLPKIYKKMNYIKMSLHPNINYNIQFFLNTFY